MRANTNILYGLYAIFVRVPWHILRGVFLTARGAFPVVLSFLTWCGPRLSIWFMLFLKHVLPLIIFVVAWFFLWAHLASWFFLSAGDRQKNPNDPYFIAALTTMGLIPLLLMLHKIGRLYRKNPW